MVVEHITPVDDFLKQAKKIEITLHQNMDENQLKSLKKGLDKSPDGQTEVLLQTSFKDNTGRQALVEITPQGGPRSIQTSYDFLQKIRKLIEREGRLRLFAEKQTKPF